MEGWSVQAIWSVASVVLGGINQFFLLFALLSIIFLSIRSRKSFEKRSDA